MRRLSEISASLRGATLTTFWWRFASDNRLRPDSGRGAHSWAMPPHMIRLIGVPRPTGENRMVHISLPLVPALLDDRARYALECDLAPLRGLELRPMRRPSVTRMRKLRPAS
jgi:hypothetical protein